MKSNAPTLKSKTVADNVTWLSIAILYIGPFWWFGSNTGWRGISFAFTGVALLIHAYLLASKKLRIEWRSARLLLASFILFVLYLALNSVFISEVDKSLSRVLYFTLFMFNVAMLTFDEKKFRLVAAIIVIISASYAVFVLCSLYMTDGLPKAYRVKGITTSAYSGVAEFGNTIVMAMHFSFAFVLAFYLSLVAKKNTVSLVWLVVLLPIAVVVALTFARSSWVLVTAACIILMASLYRKDKLPIYILLFAVALLLMGLISQHLTYEVTQRGVTHRDTIWLEVLSRMKGNWLFGYGLLEKFEAIKIKGNTFVHNSHNVYLEVLYQTGIIGLLLFVSILLFVLHKLFKSKERHEAKLFLAAIASTSCVIFVELNSFMDTPNLIWQLLWLPIGLSLSLTIKKVHIAP